LFSTNWQLQAELGKPSILHPDKGKVSIFVDCSPTAEPMFEVGDFLCLDKIENNQSDTLFDFPYAHYLAMWLWCLFLNLLDLLWDMHLGFAKIL